MSRLMQHLHGDGKGGAPRKHGLGRGLDALIKDGTPAGQQPPPVAAAGSANLTVPVERIKASPWQPRRAFEKEALAELAASIREHGVLNPLLVRIAGDSYELIAGERRLRAAVEAGLKEVPILIKDAADSKSLMLALVENLHRDDLNVLEEAAAYQMLSEKFGLTQEQIADRVGKARASVTNTMRLLSLPGEIKQFVLSGQLSAGHAKVLSGLQIEQEQILFARRAIKEDLSVRALEKAIEKAIRAPRKPRASKDDVPASHISYLSDKLHAHFGTSVRLFSSKTYANGKKARGTVEVDFYSSEDLDRILEIMGISEEVK